VLHNDWNVDDGADEGANDEEDEEEEDDEEEEVVKNDVSLHHLLHEKSGINFLPLRVEQSMSR
jgi:hypothetical protein